MHFHINYGVFLPFGSLNVRKEKSQACGNMTDAVFACGLEIIRIINDSLGIENKGEDLLRRGKELALFMHS